jgi:hypothetical protein
MLADRLKMPIAKVMELSVLELDLWSAYIKKEQDVANKQVRQMKTRRR